MCHLCRRAVQSVSRHLTPLSITHRPLTHINTITAHRTFATVGVPVLPESQREPDNIYRRPQVRPPTSPLAENNDLTWNDAQAPEPTIDDFANGPARMYTVVNINRVSSAFISMY